MGVIRCLPDGVEVPFEKAANLLQALVGKNVPIAHACGGHARCSTCRVRVLEGLAACGPRTEAEQRMADRLRFTSDIRLACQTEVLGATEVKRLILDDEDVDLANQLPAGATGGGIGREQFVAVLFADIAGFTSMSEALPAYDIVHLLNRFYTAAGRAVGEHGGGIANYMGDGLMALFGLRDRGEPPWGAVQAGLGVLEAADRVGAYFHEVYGCTFGVRVGVHCGPAIVGDIGAAGERRETAIGDTINFAARLEAANKETGTRLLVSDDVRRRVEGRAAFGASFEIDVRGKTGRFAVHEVVGTAE